MAGNPIQQSIHQKLLQVFGIGLALSEWSVRHQSVDTFADTRAYAPRLDIAVGPFNTSSDNRFRDVEAIQRIEHPSIIRLRQAILEQSDGVLFENRNPRCLIGIEIEQSTSSKHILGGITNASMLGRFGVIIAPPERMNRIYRIHNYARKLIEVEKAPNDLFGNVGCFEPDTFCQLFD